MRNILKVDCSARLDGSHSRALSDHFCKACLEKFPDCSVTNRDVAKEPIAHIHQSTIEGFYTPDELLTNEHRTALETSNELIMELRAADHLLLSIPIYNFSIPSALKAWIDQVVRIGETFSYDGENFEGLLEIERATVICVYGASGYLEGEPFNSANFLEPYIRFLLGFLGITRVEFVSLQATTGDATVLVSSIERAKAELNKITNAL